MARKTTAEVFTEKADTNGPHPLVRGVAGRCHIWTGRINRDGYGTIWVSGRHEGAHRFAYQLLVGPIPEGLHIDHLCRNRACVNPAHLEPVTKKINTLRGVSPAAQHARQTHCLNGHPFDEANTIWRKSRGGRDCRACHREHYLTRYANDPEYVAKKRAADRERYLRRRAAQTAATTRKAA